MKNLSYIGLVALLMAIMAASVSVAQDPEASVFIDGFGDIPLLDEFQEVPDSRMIFDTPSGTIANIRLSSTLGARAAIEAYSAALEALGWQPHAINEGGCERLTISYTRDDMVLTIATSDLESGSRAFLLLQPGIEQSP